MNKRKKVIELKKQIRLANYKTILHMRDDGWCDGCEETFEECLLRGICKGQEELENVTKKNI